LASLCSVDLAADIGLKSAQFGFLLAASGVEMVWARSWGIGDDHFTTSLYPWWFFLSMAFV